MNTILDLLARDEVQTIVLSLVSLLAGLLLRWQAVKKWRLEKLVQALEAAVRETYEEYVRQHKLAAADGKLTDEERQAAMRLAITRAREIAARDGIDLLKYYAKEYLPVLVEKIIGKQKSGALGLLPLAVPALPDLSPAQR